MIFSVAEKLLIACNLVFFKLRANLSKRFIHFVFRGVGFPRNHILSLFCDNFRIYIKREEQNFLFGLNAVAVCYLLYRYFVIADIFAVVGFKSLKPLKKLLF